MRLKIRGIILGALAFAAALAVAACGASGPSAGRRVEGGVHDGASTSASVNASNDPTEATIGRATQAADASSLGGLGSVTSKHERLNLEIRTNEKLNGEEQPRYVPTHATAAALKDWTGHLIVKRGETVTLTITNRDDGSAPLAPGYAQFDEAQSVREAVDDVRVHSVPNSEIAHTFTVLGLDVNAVIPAAPKGSANTIVVTFTPTKTGTFNWQCMAPCGEGEGFGGAMDPDGWMAGTITVVS